MTVRVSKPAFNLRSKLTELEYGTIPYNKLPAGSVIQYVTPPCSWINNRFSTTSTSYVVNTMELEQRFGTRSDYGALDWSGQTLRYECPAVEYLDLHIDVEYHTYDGATVSFDTRYRQMS